MECVMPHKRATRTPYLRYNYFYIIAFTEIVFFKDYNSLTLLLYCVIEYVKMPSLAISSTK